MEISILVNSLIEYCIEKNFFSKDDEIFQRNILIGLLEIENFNLKGKKEEKLNLENILDEILNYAIGKGIIKENITERDLFISRIMGALLPRPSEVRKKFRELEKERGIKKGLAWYYEISHISQYIKKKRIEKNKKWKIETKYGELEITINLSKPEKDPKEIAKAKEIKNGNYPKCFLCKENEGFAGNYSHPGRRNHRIIPLELGKEGWNFQFSPYLYYPEHSIIFSDEHRPMKVGEKNLGNLLEFLDRVPHYFIGSNADLPIVGGSILTHDHFQGGNYIFPMDRAKVLKEIEGKGRVKIEILKWPLSVIRVKGEKKEVLKLGTRILNLWRNYDDPSLGIYSMTNGESHNTVTPIARKEGKNYILNLVLRNNRTTERSPLGVFHPRKEYHNIKKENIGLIEVMGLAILPGRLKKEINKLKECLIKGKTKEEIENDMELKKHSDWYEYLKGKARNEKISFEKEVGLVFEKVLEDAGVFKGGKEGIDGFMRFIEKI